MKALLIAAGLILAGCSHSEKVYLPDGTVGYATVCRNEAQCVIRASRKCGDQGYYLLMGADGIETIDIGGASENISFIFACGIGPAAETPDPNLKQT